MMRWPIKFFRHGFNEKDTQMKFHKKNIKFFKLIYLGFFSLFLWGTFERCEAEDADPQKSNECVRDFDIGSLIKNSKIQKEKLDPLLTYFRCRAAAKQDINECNNLPDPVRCIEDAQRKKIILQTVLSASLGASEVPIPDINTYPRKKIKDHYDLSVGLSKALKKNLSACKNTEDPQMANLCNAILKREPGYCAGDQRCSESYYFIVAVEKFDAGQCKRIKDTAVRVLCQAAVEGDVKICEQDPAFKTFRTNYCAEYKNREREESQK